MKENTTLLEEMEKYFNGDTKRIQHFKRVHIFAYLMGLMMRLPEDEFFILEAAAITHDIGIKTSEEKYGDCTGKHQEEEGPPAARELFTRLGYDEKVIDRVTWLIGHHHTYDNIEGMDYQILVEADLLINMIDENTPMEGIRAAYDKIFKTWVGRAMCRGIFGIESNENEEEVRPCDISSGN